MPIKTTVNTKVHQILKDAGAAKGLTKDEIDAMIALGNDGVMNMVKKELLNKAMSGQIEKKKLAEVYRFLDELSREYRNAQREAIEKVISKKNELMKEYLLEYIQKCKRDIQNMEALERKLAIFLAKNK